jgi:F0F1-type ATP synthase assembly protein I
MTPTNGSRDAESDDEGRGRRDPDAWRGGGPADAARRQPNQPNRQPGRERTPGEAWNAVGTLGAGIAFWGLVGWGIDRLTGLHHVFLPIGIILGLAAALYLVIYQALRN